MVQQQWASTRQMQMAANWATQTAYMRRTTSTDGSAIFHRTQLLQDIDTAPGKCMHVHIQQSGFKVYRVCWQPGARGVLFLFETVCTQAQRSSQLR